MSTLEDIIFGSKLNLLNRVSASRPMLKAATTPTSLPNQKIDLTPLPGPIMPLEMPDTPARPTDEEINKLLDAAGGAPPAVNSSTPAAPPTYPGMKYNNSSFWSGNFSNIDPSMPTAGGAFYPPSNYFPSGVGDGNRRGPVTGGGNPPQPFGMYDSTKGGYIFNPYYAQSRPQWQRFAVHPGVQHMWQAIDAQIKQLQQDPNWQSTDAAKQVKDLQEQQTLLNRQAMAAGYMPYNMPIKQPNLLNNPYGDVSQTELINMLIQGGPAYEEDPVKRKQIQEVLASQFSTLDAYHTVVPQLMRNAAHSIAVQNKIDSTNRYYQRAYDQRHWGSSHGPVQGMGRYGAQQPSIYTTSTPEWEQPRMVPYYEDPDLEIAASRRRNGYNQYTGAPFNSVETAWSSPAGKAIGDAAIARQEEMRRRMDPNSAYNQNKFQLARQRQQQANQAYHDKVQQDTAYSYDAKNSAVQNKEKFEKAQSNYDTLRNNYAENLYRRNIDSWRAKGYTDEQISYFVNKETNKYLERLGVTKPKWNAESIASDTAVDENFKHPTESPDRATSPFIPGSY